MNILTSLLNRVTMYQTMLIILRVLIAAVAILSFFGVLSYTWWHILVNMGLLIIFCLATNLGFAKLFKVKPNYESQYITAEILTLIVGPLNPLTDWWVMLLISFFAMAGKYILVYGKRHIFNPAGTGVLAAALLIGQGASWWVGSRPMLPLVALGAVVIAQKLRQWHLILSFLGTYLALLAASLLFQGAQFAAVLSAWQSTLLDSALVFFAAVMLVEPATAPRTRKLRMAYGASIAAIMVGLPLAFPNFGYSIEASLLLGNLLFFLGTGKVRRQTLKLVEKRQLNHDTHAFCFTPEQHMDFQAGQYLEWTLAHAKHDSRGIRRFFTISSSPTQERIRLTTKLSPKSSTFKQALAALPLGGEIVVSQMGGEFVLPKSAGQKLAFIAGGVGITPFLSMAKYLVDINQKRDIILLFANKTKDDIFLEDELAAAAPMGLKTVHVLGEPPVGWTGPSGFITADIIKSQVPDWADRLFYVSGPEPMVMAMEKMLMGMGIPTEKITRDYFPGYLA